MPFSLIANAYEPRATRLPPFGPIGSSPQDLFKPTVLAPGARDVFFILHYSLCGYRDIDLSPLTDVGIPLPSLRVRQNSTDLSASSTTPFPESGLRE